jgi:hypothetical protein
MEAPLVRPFDRREGPLLLSILDDFPLFPSLDPVLKIQHNTSRRFEELCSTGSLKHATHSMWAHLLSVGDNKTEPVAC